MMKDQKNPHTNIIIGQIHSSLHLESKKYQCGVYVPNKKQLMLFFNEHFFTYIIIALRNYVLIYYIFFNSNIYLHYKYLAF